MVEPEDYGPLDRAISKLKTYDWVIFTSVNGVQAFFRRLRHQHKDVRELHQARLCAIGPKTGEALENCGLLVETVPEKYRAEEIIEALRDRIGAGTKILLPRADIARKVLPEALRQMGADVTEVTAYRTVAGDGDSTRIREMLARGEIHLITFTSSSTVRNLVKMLNAPDLQALLKNVVVACIGPVTAGTARELGLKVDVVAEEYTIEGLVRSLLGYYGLQTV